MRSFFENAEIIVVHNGIRFDKVVCEKLLGIEIKAKIVDTLALSMYLYPKRPRHGLESWGETLGVKKPIIHDWYNQSQEVYEKRCEEDVKINKKLWDKMLRDLYSIYGSKKEIWRLLDYLSFKFECAALQEKDKWKVDVEFATRILQDMEKERDERVKALEDSMPKVPIIKKKVKPKRLYNKEKNLTKIGLQWAKLCNDNGHSIDYDGEIEIVDGYGKPNSKSTPQIKSWLFSLGWKPVTFKYEKESDGSLRKIPQINLPEGKGICESIKDLLDIEPRLENLDGLSILNHRIPLLSGILNSLDEDNCTKAQIQGLTNTLRFIHRTLVNLPRIDRPYSEGIRGSLISRDGYILCGADMSSLEDRIKQHFIYKFDPDYVEQMNSEDFDPHLVIAKMAGMMTGASIEEYKSSPEGSKKWKPTRSIAKNGNYACQYGAGVPRLMLTCGIDRSSAEALHKAYHELNWAIKAVANEQIFKTVDEQMWLFNPISKLWYSLRNEKDIFSTLVQGTASYVFDLWVKEILSKRYQLTGQFHDEVVLEIKEGFEKECEELLNTCINNVNNILKLNRELGIGIQFGKRYSEIH